MVGQVRHVQRRSVFRVRGAEDVAVCVEGQEVAQVAANSSEIRDDAVVHEDMAAEDERVGVYLRNDAAAAGADVGEDALCFGVLAK